MVLGVEKVEDGMVAIKLQIPSEAFKEGLYQAYLKEKGKYNLPGFRKGKAPKKIIENYYGEQVFYEAAVDEVFSDAYKEALEKHDLEPVEQPSVDIEQIGQEKDLVLTAKVTVRPQVKLGKYRGVSVEKQIIEVSDKDVDEFIEQIADRNARFVDVDRPIENGDRVFLDYSGSVDGVKFDGGTAEGQQLVIGSGTFIPGFEEQMIGMKKGEEKDLTVNFPEQYHSAELAGKEAIFHVKVNDIKGKEVQKIDDEFAKDVSEFDTLKEYKASIRERLEKEAEEKMTNQVSNDAVDAAIANIEVEVPKVMIEIEIGRLIRDLEQRLQSQGMDLKMYLDYIGTTLAQVKENFRPEAERLVKSRLMMEEIEKAEDIVITEEMVEDYYKEAAEKLKKTVEEYKEMLPPGDMEYQKNRLKWKKIIDDIVDNAKVKEVKELSKNKETAKKAPAKKPAAKKETTTKTTAAAKKSTTAKKTTTTKKTTAKKTEDK